MATPVPCSVAAERWSLVFASGSWVEASLVANALEGSGLTTLTVDGDICRLVPSTSAVVQGVKVLVDARDEADAVALLGDILGGQPPYTGSWLTMPMSLPALVFQMLRNFLLRPRDPAV